jgi:hypothetical protein
MSMESLFSNSLSVKIAYEALDVTLGVEKQERPRARRVRLWETRGSITVRNQSGYAHSHLWIAFVSPQTDGNIIYVALEFL